MRSLKLLVFFTLILGVLGGCAALSLPNNPGGMDPINPTDDPTETSVILYFSDDQAMFVLAEQRTILSGDEPLPNLLVKELIAGPENSELRRTLPAETELLSLEIKDQVAYVNFSQAVVDKHWGGSAGELMTVASVVNTLTELPEIDSVQFLVEGEVRESIWGHGITSEPIGRMEDLIGE